MTFADAPTDVLLAIRRNLLGGLDKVAEHLDADTFHDVGDKGKAPPSESGHLTLALLQQVDETLKRRKNQMSKPRTVLVDVDGTVALMGKGEPGRRQPWHWHRVSEDDPNLPIIELVALFRRAGYEIVFVSGRDEVCRTDTQVWLLQHGAAQNSDYLFMRAHGDNRPDDEIKRELYYARVEPNYDVAYVLDDRSKVVRAWREMGLTVLQVADGDF